MDSNVRAKAILVVSIFCLLLFLVVALINREAVKETKAPTSASVEAETVDVSEEMSWKELQRFLDDPSFFDEPEVPTQPVNDDALPTLHILVETAMQDIRVLVINEAGQLVTGHPFEVLVEKEEYYDLDKDGVILIPDIAPGEYFVSLKTALGFHVPYEPVLVEVPENLLYKPLKDIAYRLKVATEESKISYLTEADKTTAEDTKLKKIQNCSTGIDVSSTNGTIDWKSVKEAGVEFAILCCGYRSPETGSLMEDASYKDNISGAKAEGIPVGIYFESQAVSEMEAVEEASAAITLLEGMQTELPIFISFGDADGRAALLTVENRTAIALAFMKTVDTAGYEVGVFGSRTMLDERVFLEEIPFGQVWAGEYGKELTLNHPYAIWQYSDHGQIAGISGWVHLNLMHN